MQEDPGEELVSVYTLTNSTQAEILKNALENEGIRCEIEGERQGGWTGVLTIRLLVHQRDAQRAYEFIEAHEG